MQPYLRSTLLSTKEKQTLFALRSRSLPLKANQKSMFKDNLICRICQDMQSKEDEDHIFFHCDRLLGNISRPTNIKLEDIFGTIDKQVPAIKFFMKIIERRNILLDLLEDRDLC